MITIVLLIIIVILTYLYFSKTNEDFSNIENSRGNLDYRFYPPCYDESDSVRNIFDILKKKKLLDENYTLLNVYSFVLCQEKYLNQKLCGDTMIVERINNMKQLGFDKISDAQYVKYESLVNSILTPEKRIQLNSLSKIFLTAATYLIENNLYNLKKKLLPEEWDRIYKLTQEFYKKHYPSIHSKC